MVMPQFGTSVSKLISPKLEFCSRVTAEEKWCCKMGAGRCNGAVHWAPVGYSQGLANQTTR